MDSTEVDVDHQAFRFMVGLGHCTMFSKYGPPLSKAVGPVDPSFLVVKKFHFDKKYSSYGESTNSTIQYKIYIYSRKYKQYNNSVKSFCISGGDVV